VTIDARIRHMIVFRNGNVAACDADGQQIVEYQGNVHRDPTLIRRVRAAAAPDVEWIGIEHLPPEPKTARSTSEQRYAWRKLVDLPHWEAPELVEADDAIKSLLGEVDLLERELREVRSAREASARAIGRLSREGAGDKSTKIYDGEFVLAARNVECPVCAAPPGSPCAQVQPQGAGWSLVVGGGHQGEMASWAHLGRDLFALVEQTAALRDASAADDQERRKLDDVRLALRGELFGPFGVSTVVASEAAALYKKHALAIADLAKLKEEFAEMKQKHAVAAFESDQKLAASAAHSGELVDLIDRIDRILSVRNGARVIDVAGVIAAIEKLLDRNRAAEEVLSRVREALRGIGAMVIDPFDVVNPPEVVKS
jgi:hypothetical protein